MKSAVLLIGLSGAALVGCAYLPTSGPTAGDVIDRGMQENQIRYDVVDVDSGVVAILLAQPAESFRTRFGKYGMPAAPKIGIGDTLSVSIWEAAGGGLFGTSPTDHVSAGSRSVTIPEQVVARDGAWVLAPGPASGATTEIAGRDSAIALFALGRIGVDDPRLAVIGSDAAAFKTWFPGP